jgi:hypothetical protein
LSSALFAGEELLFMIPRVDSLVVAWKRGRICKHECRRFLLSLFEKRRLSINLRRKRSRKTSFCLRHVVYLEYSSHSMYLGNCYTVRNRKCYDLFGFSVTCGLAEAKLWPPCKFASA